mmetsp:Transcript_2482/g.4281  ORF Transcript_2482/g.4281 Transcript_2482/m.4281 type:complete len:572 (-) Transcript_2482:73-1788(-)
MGCSQSTPAAAGAPAPAAAMEEKALGVIRLDYDYPPAKGDIDHPGSFCYPVYYRVVPGLTFQMCQSGQMTPEVETRFADAIKYLESRKVSAITGDCGFMMYFQQKARQLTKKPVFMSSLAHLPAITTSYAPTEKIAIFTANSTTLTPMKPLIKDECGVEVDDQRYVIVGCQDVDGFEAVEKGEKVDLAKVTPGIVKKCKETLAKDPSIKAICFECTQLPPFSDALRHITQIPVFDAITCCDFFMSGLRDNPRFGVDDWHKQWDGVQEEYKFGKNLTAEEKAALQNKAAEDETMKMSQLVDPLVKKQKQAMHLFSKVRAERCGAKVGILRMPGERTAQAGDIISPQSFAYDVSFKEVAGLTKEMCLSGSITDDVKSKVQEAIGQLVDQNGAKSIAGDSSAMVHLQSLVRQHSSVPVAMSPLTQLPAILCSFSKSEKVAILSDASGDFSKAVAAMKESYGSAFDDNRLVVVSCTDVSQAGLVAKAKEAVSKNASVRAFLVENPELPRFSDAIRAATGLPVYDAITGCDMFMSGFMDNPRFSSSTAWHLNWDGVQETMEWMKYLSPADKQQYGK